MIDHDYISVTNIVTSMAFYSVALKPFGWRIFGNYDSTFGPEGVPDLYSIGDDIYGSGKGVGSSIWLWPGPNDWSGLNVSAGSVQAQPVLWPAELVGVAQPAIARLRALVVCSPRMSVGAVYYNVFSRLQ